ncbi:MAG: RNA methyltransferase [Bacteroidetes bacterium]|nr:RNA methyltransferase [Bacteroidota bacterium]
MEKIKNEDLGRLSVAAFKQAAKLPIIIVLDNVRSALNVGNIFRTCDAFRVEKILLCGITAVPPNKDIYKSALGATETVAWEYFENTMDAIEHLKENNYVCVAVEQVQNSIRLNKLNWNGEKTALIFGHEVDGVSQAVVDQSDYSLEIPQVGTKHSLNISVCHGVVMWKFFESI